tara:strand:- start:546 stop:1193 length:648 start_codon:yes stop_codon:yes gene_type:complete
MKITKRQLRKIIKEALEEFTESKDILERSNTEYTVSQYPSLKPSKDAQSRRPELQAILDAADAAHGVVPYAVLKNFFWSLNSTYATERRIMEGEQIDQLKRIIRETLSKRNKLVHEIRDMGDDLMLEMEYTKDMKALRRIAEDEAMKWFKAGPVGRMTRKAWVTSVRTSPDSPEFELDIILRVSIATDSGDKRQIDVILDSETGAFRGVSEVDRY